MRRRAGTAIIAAALGAIPLGAASADPAPESWRLPEPAVRCILDNAQAYLETNRRVIIIRASICPETDVNAAAMASKQNSLVPGISASRDRADGDGDFDDLIVYTAEQISCLAALDRAAPLSALPKKPRCQ